MSQRPHTVTGLAIEPAIARVVLTWNPLPWTPLIDHFRVYGVPGRDGRPQERPEHLLGKTVYPRFVHAGLDPRGSEWSYLVVAVSDAGQRSRPSAVISGSSQASVIATGTELARVGEFDGKGSELLFSPASYAKIPTTYPTAIITYTQGVDQPGTGWPYLLPGPGDGWAGRKVYRVLWTVPLATAPTTPVDLAAWLIDTTRLGGVLTVRVNGAEVQRVTLAKGATLGSRNADATLPNSTMVRAYHEFALPEGALVAGTNVVEFELTEGGWVAWDAVGLYAR